MSPVALSPADVQDHLWDVVVIGTGAGGGTVGHALARQGRSVLFLERGSPAESPERVRGRAFGWTGQPHAALAHGWWPDPLHRVYGPHLVPGHHPFGAGSGGGTALFGMVMDRLRPMDFEPRRLFPEAPDASLPDRWPVTYDELAPYYDAAERLYRVKGTPDPLEPRAGGVMAPGPPTPKEAAVTAALEDAGLHPYRIHYAQDRVPQCQGCAAMLCPHPCRNDAGRICVAPAVAEHGAHVLHDCRVVRLEARQRAVQAATCDWRGTPIAVRGRLFVLAANAIFSPALLLRSISDRFPNGLANGSGQVGRHLMVHVSDFLLGLPRRGHGGGRGAMHHGVAFNDFYRHGGQKLGNVHVHPVAITGEMTRGFLQLHVKAVNRLPDAVLAAGAALGAAATRGAVVFSTIVEDLPYPCNRVTPRAGSDSLAAWEYRYPHELRVRAHALHQRFAAAVQDRYRLWPLRPLGQLNMSHACGTCRLGDDPRTSVLDRDGRAHDVDNLYVVDGSFFPSSGGINPSLTIAAQALRVADRLADRT